MKQLHTGLLTYVWNDGMIYFDISQKWGRIYAKKTALQMDRRLPGPLGILP